MDLINRFLTENGMSEEMAVYFTAGIMIVFIILLSIVAHYITKKIVVQFITKLITRNKFKWDDILVHRQVFVKLSHLVPAIIIYQFAPAFPDFQAFIEKMAFLYMIIVILAVLNAALNAVNDIYQTFEISKIRPIRGYIQVVKIFMFIMGGIIIIANLIGESPFLILSGLGALSAVLMLIFKDSILGLVAGVQLTANDMVRVGDWIEMPKYGADGDVIEITLNTVKVRNWDKTITMIPAYALISDSFKNWRGMIETGGRRIKRAIYIDMTSIQFCTEEMIEKFKRIQYLKDYIESKEKEIAEYNEEHHIDPSSIVNGRRMTNVGTFRIYIQNYVKNHPGIHQELLLLIRQLAPGEHGLPIEIYAFTKDTRWVVHESVMADIFDHLLAAAPEFGLRVFQNPTGHDMRNMALLRTSGSD